MAGVDDGQQVWVTKGWAERFALPLDPSDTGYGHDAETVGLVSAEAPLLLGYFEDVHREDPAVRRYAHEDDLDRVVDARRDPPVTLQVRLVSVIADDLQHVGPGRLRARHPPRVAARPRGPASRPPSRLSAMPAQMAATARSAHPGHGGLAGHPTGEHRTGQHL